MAAPICARLPSRVLRRAKVPWLVPTHGQRHRSNLLEFNVTSEGVDIVELAKQRGIGKKEQPKHDEETQRKLDSLREPQNLATIRLAPLRRQAQYGIPVCDLQLRTYHIRNLDLFADFALRAAYYLGLPAKGPIALPRITERWVVPKSNFVHKKSQENFERITRRRLIQIQDGHPETVRIWLGVLMKYQYHGVGMKANIWEHDSLDSAQIAQDSVKAAKEELDKIWNQYGTRADRTSGKKIEEALRHPRHVGILAEWEREQGLERGQFQKDIKERETREKKAARAAVWNGRSESRNAAKVHNTTADSGSVNSAATMGNAVESVVAEAPSTGSTEATPAVTETSTTEAAPTVTETLSEGIPTTTDATAVDAAPKAEIATSASAETAPVEPQAEVEDSTTKESAATTTKPSATSLARDEAPAIESSTTKEQSSPSESATVTPDTYNTELEFPTAEEIEEIANNLRDGEALRSSPREDGNEHLEPPVEPEADSSFDASKKADTSSSEQEDVPKSEKKD